MEDSVDYGDTFDRAYAQADDVEALFGFNAAEEVVVTSWAPAPGPGLGAQPRPAARAGFGPWAPASRFEPSLGPRLAPGSRGSRPRAPARGPGPGAPGAPGPARARARGPGPGARARGRAQLQRLARCRARGKRSGGL